MALTARIADAAEWNAVLELVEELEFNRHEFSTTSSEDGHKTLVVEIPPDDRRRKLLINRLWAAPLQWELTLCGPEQQTTRLWTCLVVRPEGKTRWKTELLAFLRQEDFSCFLSESPLNQIFAQQTSGELVTTFAGEAPKHWQPFVTYRSESGNADQVLCRRTPLTSPDGVLRAPPAVNHAYSSSQHRAALVAFRAIEDERSTAHTFGLIGLRTPVFAQEPQGLSQLERPKSLFLM